MNLDPAKLLVILVIALVVLGPERLPRVARQLGALWREMTVARERLVKEIKDQVPDLPDPRDLRSVLFDPSRPTSSQVNGTARDEMSGPFQAGVSVPRPWEPQARPQDRDGDLSPYDRSDPSMN